MKRIQLDKFAKRVCAIESGSRKILYTPRLAALIEILAASSLNLPLRLFPMVQEIQTHATAKF